MIAKWSERGREIILKLIALPVPLLRQVSGLGFGGLIFAVIYNVFYTFPGKMITIFWVELFGALLALRWPRCDLAASGVELGGLLEHILAPSWAK